MQQNNVDRDYLETLTRRIEALEQLVAQMRNNMKPTVPIYDSTNFPQNPVEGQIALGTDNQAYKYQSGAWSPIGGGIQFDTDNEGGWLYIQTNDTSEAGGSLHGFGIDLRDFDSASDGVRFSTEYGDVIIRADGDAGTGDVVLDAEAGDISLGTGVGVGGGSGFYRFGLDLLHTGVHTLRSDSFSLVALLGDRTFPTPTVRAAITIAASPDPTLIADVENIIMSILNGTGLLMITDSARTLGAFFRITGATFDLRLIGLPTFDPGVSGQIYNDGGILKISP